MELLVFMGFFALLAGGLAGIGGRRIAPTGAPGDWSAEPDLCPHSKKLNR